MGTSSTDTIGNTTCGILLSPNFPGVVEQGAWTWRIDQEKEFYFHINVYYVAGPASSATQEKSCDQFFSSKRHILFLKNIIRICLSKNIKERRVILNF